SCAGSFKTTANPTLSQYPSPKAKPKISVLPRALCASVVKTPEPARPCTYHYKILTNPHRKSPRMLIAEQHLGHWIENFYGYGSWKARFWFVGYEESGGDVPEEVAEKINYFFEQHQPDTNGTLCNIRELYQHVSIWWEGPKAN